MESLSTVIEKSLQQAKADIICRQNSNSSYTAILPSLGEKQQIVFGCILLGCRTPYEIEQLSGLCLRTVATRCTELKHAGYITVTGSIKGQHGRKTSVFEVTNDFKTDDINQDELRNSILEYRQLVIMDNKSFTFGELNEILSQHYSEEETNKIIATLKKSVF